MQAAINEGVTRLALILYCNITSWFAIALAENLTDFKRKDGLQAVFQLLSFPFSFKKLEIPVKRSTDGETEGRGGG